MLQFINFAVYGVDGVSLDELVVDHIVQNCDWSYSIISTVHNSTRAGYVLARCVVVLSVLLICSETQYIFYKSKVILKSDDFDAMSINDFNQQLIH